MSVAMHTLIRSATVTLLESYASSAGIDLQVYPALPTTIHPPTAYIDRITERTVQTGITLYQRYVRPEIVVLFRQFAEGERASAAAQKDAFVDGFLTTVENNFHAIDPVALLRPDRVDDNPEYQIADPKRGVITYFAARITLEGYVETN